MSNQLFRVPSGLSAVSLTRGRKAPPVPAKVVDVGNVFGRFGGRFDRLQPSCGIVLCFHHCMVRAIPAGGRSGNDENTTATSRESSTGDQARRPLTYYLRRRFRS